MWKLMESFIERVFQESNDGHCANVIQNSEHVYVYTMLEAYKVLPRVFKNIDSFVFKKALSSHNVIPSGHGAIPTIRQIEEIIEVMEKKSELIEMKVALLSGFKSLPLLSLKIIYARFIHGMTVKRVAALTGTSEATVVRRSTSGIKTLYTALTFEGYDKNWFEETFLKQKWIAKIYTQMK